MKYKLYQANWSLPTGEGTAEHIKSYCIGTVLNLCCGKSNLGDLRLDLDPITKPSLIADVFDPPLQRLSFDTVLIDPPYSYFNRFKWIYKLGDLARKRVIISAGQILVTIPKFKLVDIVAVILPNLFYVRLWYIFDRIQHDL